MQKIGSFLKWLWSIISGGIHVGDKNEDKSTHDSAPKQSVSGLKSSANMTIGTNNSYSFQGQQNTISGEGIQLVINSPCELNVSATSNTASPRSISPLSEQAKSLIRQMIENHSEMIIVFEPVGIVDTIVLFEAKKEMTIEDKLSVSDDLKALELNEYLRYCKPNDNLTGQIYALTAKGREYGKKLIEENRGSTSI